MTSENAENLKGFQNPGKGRITKRFIQPTIPGTGLQTSRSIQTLRPQKGIEKLRRKPSVTFRHQQ